MKRIGLSLFLSIWLHEEVARAAPPTYVAANPTIYVPSKTTSFAQPTGTDSAVYDSNGLYYVPGPDLNKAVLQILNEKCGSAVDASCINSVKEKIGGGASKNGLQRRIAVLAAAGPYIAAVFAFVIPIYWAHKAIEDRESFLPKTWVVPHEQTTSLQSWSDVSDIVFQTSSGAGGVTVTMEVEAKPTSGVPSFEKKTNGSYVMHLQQLNLDDLKGVLEGACDSAQNTTSKKRSSGCAVTRTQRILRGAQGGGPYQLLLYAGTAAFPQMRNQVLLDTYHQAFEYTASLAYVVAGGITDQIRQNVATWAAWLSFLFEEAHIDIIEDIIISEDLAEQQTPTEDDPSPTSATSSPTSSSTTCTMKPEDKLFCTNCGGDSGQGDPNDETTGRCIGIKPKMTYGTCPCFKDEDIGPNISEADFKAAIQSFMNLPNYGLTCGGQDNKGFVRRQVVYDKAMSWCEERSQGQKTGIDVLQPRRFYLHAQPLDTSAPVDKEECKSAFAQTIDNCDINNLAKKGGMFISNETLTSYYWEAYYTDPEVVCPTDKSKKISIESAQSSITNLCQQLPQGIGSKEDKSTSTYGKMQILLQWYQGATLTTQDCYDLLREKLTNGCKDGNDFIGGELWTEKYHWAITLTDDDSDDNSDDEGRDIPTGGCKRGEKARAKGLRCIVI